MLRVGLTGGLGSGKSTAAAMLARHGAYAISADELGRELMEPGQEVYGAIVERFGAGVVRADGRLDRGELARLAFAGGRVEELNAIVHPAVIVEQERRIAEIGARNPEAVVVVESALIFETRYGEARDGNRGQGWRGRFDRLILVTAPEPVKVARFIRRALESGSGMGVVQIEAEARRRLGQQIPDERKAPFCDYVLGNEGTVAELQGLVDGLWTVLSSVAREQQRF